MPYLLSTPPPRKAQFIRCHPLLQSHDFTMTSRTKPQHSWGLHFGQNYHTHTHTHWWAAPHPVHVSYKTIFGAVLGAANQSDTRRGGRGTVQRDSGRSVAPRGIQQKEEFENGAFRQTPIGISAHLGQCSFASADLSCRLSSSKMFICRNVFIQSLPSQTVHKPCTQLLNELICLSIGLDLELQLAIIEITS